MDFSATFRSEAKEKSKADKKIFDSSINLYKITIFDSYEENMWHIFGYHLRDAFIHLEEGKIEEAKNELRHISEDGYNINKELGRLIILAERFPGYIESALRAKDIEEMKNDVTEAQIILQQIIEKMQHILKEEMREE